MGNSKTKKEVSLKQVIIVALLFMLVGTALELYLLEHYEDIKQLIPLVCVSASLVMVLILPFYRTSFTQRLYKWIMIITAFSGVYGVFLHLKANFEFEQEMKPSAGSWDLFVESLSGALPALAPASMIALALIGYSYYLLLKKQP